MSRARAAFDPELLAADMGDVLRLLAVAAGAVDRREPDAPLALNTARYRLAMVLAHYDLIPDPPPPGDPAR